MTPPDGRERRIRKLPALLVNQIAAGEVVERPASVVKELVDNALDAGATRITVDLEGGGIELVRVTDDGCGIAPEDLSLALADHATSKITEAADLDRIGTMGFRGEALASIASVSRLSMRSRRAADTAASQVEAEGERIGQVTPAGGPVGTSVTVRNLFFNTPARRKFLRTPATEQGHCLDIVETLAMSHPAIGFAASTDGKRGIDLAPGQSPRERVVAVLGAEIESQLVEVHADRFDDSRGLAMWGVVGLPSIARATAKAQWVFLNGRPIRDKSIQHAIKEAFRGLIEPGRFPTAVLMIEMDPGAVDVNVHPRKTEVRFRDQSVVHSVVLRAIREALAGADLTPSVAGIGWRGQSGHGSAGEDRAVVGVGGSPAPGGFVDYFQRQPAAPSGERLSFEAIREAVQGGSTDPAASPRAAEPGPIDQPRPAERVLQVHNSFVVTQDEQGIVIVDQHALHERVMFEDLIARISGRGGTDGQPARLESQRMLVPPVVEVTRRQLDRLGDLAPLFERLGIEVEPIGPAAVAVQGFPTFLFDREVDAGPFVKELLEKAEASEFVPGSEEALHEVLDMMACKAAVKAGDRLTESELRDLLKMREEVERSSNCPHGRPTSIRVTIRELEKRFGRV
ncbi:MAG: DNA mismatch repair endonuclease MutL [Phycisphaeraceae bacterium]|nr:DNA mismatch repair endonuclease MutL [Phycisphaeraceae bacterium]